VLPVGARRKGRAPALGVAFLPSLPTSRRTLVAGSDADALRCQGCEYCMCCVTLSARNDAIRERDTLHVAVSGICLSDPQNVSHPLPFCWSPLLHGRMWPRRSRTRRGWPPRKPRCRASSRPSCSRDEDATARFDAGGCDRIRPGRLRGPKNSKETEQDRSKSKGRQKAASRWARDPHGEY
jgi:hypothetical protein